MSVAFYPGSARAVGSDLSISVSPLGLVELADDKVCTRCKLSKPLSEYHNNRRKKDGKDPNCKACNNERMREKYATDAGTRATKIAKTRQYHLDNPEWSQECLRAHHEANREERYEKHKQRGEDPAVREQRRSSTRRSESRRRAQKADAAVVEAITQPQLDALLAEHNGCCAICGRTVGGELVLHWDHIQPLAREGMHTIENHQPLCGPCNVRKNATWPLSDERREQIKTEVLAQAALVDDGTEVIAQCR